MALRDDLIADLNREAAATYSVTAICGHVDISSLDRTVQRTFRVRKSAPREDMIQRVIDRIPWARLEEAFGAALTRAIEVRDGVWRRYRPVLTVLDLQWADANATEYSVTIQVRITVELLGE